MTQAGRQIIEHLKLVEQGKAKLEIVSVVQKVHQIEQDYADLQAELSDTIAEARENADFCNSYR